MIYLSSLHKSNGNYLFYKERRHDTRVILVNGFEPSSRLININKNKSYIIQM